MSSTEKKNEKKKKLNKLTLNYLTHKSDFIASRWVIVIKPNTITNYKNELDLYDMSIRCVTVVIT